FVESFAQALADEVKDTGVTVTPCLPGPTDTEFFDRAGMEDDTRIGTMRKDDPAQVAEQAYEAIVKGERKALTGSLKAKAQGLAGKVLPDGLKAAAHRRMAEPGSADAWDTGDAGRRSPCRPPVPGYPCLGRRTGIGPRAVSAVTGRPAWVTSTSPADTRRQAARRAGSINARQPSSCPSSPSWALRAASDGQIDAVAARCASRSRMTCSRRRSSSRSCGSATRPVWHRERDTGATRPSPVGPARPHPGGREGEERN